MITKLCIIRHGQTDWNKKRIVQGRTNIPLNDKGILQAHECADYLKETDPLWDVIISSPLDRSIVTANVIKDTIGFKDEIIIDSNIIERNFGKVEGDSFLKAIFKGAYIKIFHKDDGGFEDNNVLSDRTTKAFKEIALKYSGKKVLIVSHSHAIKGFFITFVKGLSMNDPIPNCKPMYVTMDDTKVIDYKIN